MPGDPGLSTLERFSTAVDRPEPSIDLAEAVLLIAADAYPDLSVDHYLRVLDDLAAPVRARVRDDMPVEGFVEALNGHLFGDVGFFGNTADYYDPRNSYLNEVLDRRLGVPITLSVVYMEVARRAGLEVVGVGLPGHFIVEARRGEDAMFMDPFHGGEVLTAEDCERLVADVYGGAVRFQEDQLAPVGTRQILVRILNNLKMIYLAREDAEAAWPVVEKMVHLDPESAVDRRDRGLLAHRRNLFRQARDDLRFYLDRRAHAPDRGEIEASLRAIEAILAVMT